MSMSLQDIINTSFIILQIFCILLLPLIIWMVKSIMTQDKDIALLKKEVDEAFPARFISMEKNITNVQENLKQLTEDSIYTKSKIERIEELLVDLKKEIIRDRK